MGQDGDFRAPIDELVGLLHKFDPASLDALRGKYPGEANLLRPGMMAGKDAREDLIVRVEVCMVGLAAATKVSKEAECTVSERLKRSRTIQIFGQVLTLIGGASFFAVLALDAPAVAKYSVAVMNLVGSMLTFIARHLQAAPLSKGHSLLDLLPVLITNRFKAEALLRDLEVAQRIGGDKKTLDVIRAANLLATNIATAAAQLSL